jgi:hypothetical protein
MIKFILYKKNWGGLVWRSDGSKLKRALLYMVRGKRLRGRPRKR